MPSSLLLSKLLAGFFTTTLSLLFGFLPLCLTSKLASAASSDSVSEKPKGHPHPWLAVLLNFGGGVLIGNCFCHWLPEVREGEWIRKRQKRARIYLGGKREDERLMGKQRNTNKKGSEMAYG